MTLIKSISGIRGTIGGQVGDNLTPIDVVQFVSAFVTFLKNAVVRFFELYSFDKLKEMFAFTSWSLLESVSIIMSRRIT